MRSLKFSPDSLNDLKEIKQYISEDLVNEKSAQKIVNSILEKVKMLTFFPYSGALLSTTINIQVPYRFLVCGNYTAFYKIENDEVYIMRILYNKRNFMNILFDMDRNLEDI